MDRAIRIDRVKTGFAFPSGAVARWASAGLEIEVRAVIVSSQRGDLLGFSAAMFDVQVNGDTASHQTNQQERHMKPIGVRRHKRLKDAHAATRSAGTGAG